jgi:aryl-alcohol dehydrogenase-like predicted oxidoreductase
VAGTDVTRARLGFGCVRLGSLSGGSSFRADVALVRQAIDQGVTVFDTADAYGRGMSERVLGEAVGRARGQIRIATKAGYLFDERSRLEHLAMSAMHPVIDRLRSRSAAPTASGAQSSPAYGEKSFAADYLRHALDASLRRLRTDYVDVFQLHGPPPPSEQFADEISTLANDLLKSGKMLHFGIGAESVVSAQGWMDVPPVSVLQVPCGVLDPQATTDLIPAAQRAATEVWARGVLGGGVLSASVRGASSGQLHEKHELIDALTKLAREAGLSLYQLAVDYVRTVEGVSTILIGIHTSEQLIDCVRMMGQPPAEQAVLDEAQMTAARWFADHESK